jgi:hypothetical protein
MKAANLYFFSFFGCRCDQQLTLFRRHTEGGVALAVYRFATSLVICKQLQCSPTLITTSLLPTSLGTRLALCNNLRRCRSKAARVSEHGQKQITGWQEQALMKYSNEIYEHLCLWSDNAIEVHTHHSTGLWYSEPVMNDDWRYSRQPTRVVLPIWSLLLWICWYGMFVVYWLCGESGMGIATEYGRVMSGFSLVPRTVAFSVAQTKSQGLGYIKSNAQDQVVVR